MEGKTMLGHKVRRLRREHNLTQAEMAEQLDISPSYLNLIEHNHRPVTVSLLLSLGRTFDVDLQSFAENAEARLFAGLKEAFGDPVFEGHDISTQDVRDFAGDSPTLAQAVIELHGAYRAARADLIALGERMAGDDSLQLLRGSVFPLEEVQDFFHAHANHFPELEVLAEELWADAGLEIDDLSSRLADHLSRVHSLKIKLVPVDVMGSTLRRYDRHNRRVLLSEMLAPSGRTFQLACQIGLLQHTGAIDRITAAQAFATDDARSLARVGLINYFAGAVMMPYDRFLDAARAVRFDIDVLRQRFGASFEQVCHRLTTLQRSGAKGVPFFLIRVDKAGNVSKRFSATGLQFARSGGACPLWVVHDAFRTPGVIHTQIAEMPDGSMYFCLARTVTKTLGGYRTPAQELAIGLGCEVGHAKQLVYAEGMDLKNRQAATPIGTHCRLCERLDCASRAYPPIRHRLIVDESKRGRFPYYFSPMGAMGERPAKSRPTAAEGSGSQS
ncbi:MAG TPA: short-chain fatty acyl-CoA regulator family protein [Rhodospirillales bacterium]|jgi:hypothetical protein